VTVGPTKRSAAENDPAGSMGRPNVGGPRSPEQPVLRAPIAWFSGDDAFAIRTAVESFAARLAGGDGPSPETVHFDPENRTAPRGGGADRDMPAGGPRVEAGQAALLDEIAVRVGTAPLFGSGVLVVVREPASIVRSQEQRDRLVRLFALVAPGNGLAFAQVLETRGRETAGSAVLRAVVQAAGGLVERFEAPRPERLPAWIEERATVLGVSLGPGAARHLAEQLVGRGTEGDIDRRRQTEMADAELRKLALYRPGQPVGRDDVAALVPAAVPASAWAFLDAVGTRRGGEASSRAEALVADGTPLPVIVTQLHRRLRQLVQVADLLEARTGSEEIARELGLVRGGKVDAARFRADVLSRQAAAWRPEDLVEALDGLVEVDLASKGLLPDGSAAGRPEARGPLALQLWIAERVTRRG
jgi:DNA polymerase III delta subunit